MTIQLRITSTRPSTDAPWSDDPAVPIKNWYLTNAYYMETWHEKGRLLSTSISYSDDGLSSLVVREFLDWDSLDAFISDENLAPIRIERTAYLDSVNIQITDMETIEI